MRIAEVVPSPQRPLRTMDAHDRLLEPMDRPCASRREDDSHSVTRLLQRMREGDRNSREELYRFLYDELHRRAVACMRQQPPGHTLQATALLNEALLHMEGGEWND